jgi:hypothetical protein
MATSGDVTDGAGCEYNKTDHLKSMANMYTREAKHLEESFEK